MFESPKLIRFGGIWLETKVQSELIVVLDEKLMGSYYNSF